MPAKKVITATTVDKVAILPTAAQPTVELGKAGPRTSTTSPQTQAAASRITVADAITPLTGVTRSPTRMYTE